MNVISSGCHALLDDASAELNDELTGTPSRLYTDWVRQLVCTGPEQLGVTCAEAEAALQSGLHAVLLCDYDFGARLQGVALKSDAGCLRILLFKHMQRLTRAEVDAWLAGQDQTHDQTQDKNSSEPSAAGLCELRPGVTRQQYDDAITSIQDWLRAGDCYQINYTYPFLFQTFGTPLALYRRLRARQPAPYGALITLPDGRTVLSCSPELFVQHQEGRLTARPMKGTAPAGQSTAETQAQAEALSTDPKNRAENLMIVDLLRNDLGRIAQTGSVRVPALFSIERYADVLQMTSTVEATPRPGLHLADVLEALFPCGSITGAPKRKAMELIDQIEVEPRGLYTGAIGWIDAPTLDADETLSNFCLSVAIRTLVLDAAESTGQHVSLRAGRMGVGGGIIIDSEANLEYQECQLKAQFLTRLDPGFHLFETLHATRAGCHYFERHLQRLQISARYFGFVWRQAYIAKAVAQVCNALVPDEACRLRLSITHDGTVTVTQAPLSPLYAPVKLLLAQEKMASHNLFLRHKTSLRNVYDQAWQGAERQGAFDALFFNERDELTEGARSNVFVLLNGVWVTPPLSCGLLPGVMRAVLLDDPEWKTAEHIVTRADLMAAEGLMVCNALRGVMPAMLLG